LGNFERRYVRDRVVWPGCASRNEFLTHGTIWDGDDSGHWSRWDEPARQKVFQPWQKD